MPRLTPQAPREAREHLLVASPWRDVALTIAVLTVTVAVFGALAHQGALAWTQRLDDTWLRLMTSARVAPATAAAVFLDLLGRIYVTLPIRVALAAYLALRRRWWHFTAFVSAIVLSEILIGTLKALYDRPRPPGSLVGTSAASFPSGHAVAASVTVVAGVIALVPPGRHRAAWGAGALAFSTVMALSRAYLGAHWLSDAVAGVLLGTSCALLAALVTGALQRRRTRDREADPDVAPSRERR